MIMKTINWLKMSYYTPGRGKIVPRNVNYTPGRGKIVPRNVNYTPGRGKIVPRNERSKKMDVR